MPVGEFALALKLGLGGEPVGMGVAREAFGDAIAVEVVGESGDFLMSGGFRAGFLGALFLGGGLLLFGRFLFQGFLGRFLGGSFFLGHCY